MFRIGFSTTRPEMVRFGFQLTQQKIFRVILLISDAIVKFVRIEYLDLLPI